MLEILNLGKFKHYWGKLQIKHAMLLNNISEVVCWDTVNVEKAVVYVSDPRVIAKIPRTLFGLPVEIYHEKSSYRGNELTLLAKSKLSWLDKLKFKIINIIESFYSGGW